MHQNKLQSLTERLRRFAQAQSHEEIGRQFLVIRRVETQRRLLTAITFAVATLFLPVWLCATLFALDGAAELAGLRLMRGLDSAGQPGRYLAMLASYIAAQVFYCLLPVLCWQIDAPMSQAFAVGTAMLTLMHLATVRSVHLPLGLGGAIATIVVAALGNGWYWLQMGAWAAFLISSLCVVAAGTFAIMTLLSVHRLQEEMARGRAAAQAADQTKLRFLAQMSHELRTPLNAILGMGNAELAQATAPESRSRLEVLIRAAAGLSTMLDDILDLSAMQAGELPIRPRALDLRAEIDATVAIFRQQAEDAGLVLRLTLHDSLPHHARLDGQRLRQCLSNILSNAVKHTVAGMITVHAYEGGAGRLAIKVTDTGPGVPDEVREKIFEPFHRGPHNLPGTGLGMSIARTLARRMGGDLILLPSTAGAHFLLTLAFAPATAADLPVTQTATEATLCGLRVLVVDDIATNRQVAATCLRRLGADPSEAASGAEAIAIVTGPNPPDLILMDILMPGMDGPTTLRHISDARAGRPAIPVIAMSADMTEETRQDGSSPFAGFVVKPLSVESLSRALAPHAPQRITRPMAEVVPDPPKDLAGLRKIAPKTRPVGL